MINVGQNVTKDCVLYNCESYQNNLQYLKVLEGGKHVHWTRLCAFHDFCCLLDTMTSCCVSKRSFLISTRLGCSWNGKCVRENTTWTETKGDMCTRYTCSKFKEGSYSKYKVKQVHKGQWMFRRSLHLIKRFIFKIYVIFCHRDRNSGDLIWFVFNIFVILLLSIPHVDLFRYFPVCQNREKLFPQRSMSIKYHGH